MIRFVVPTGCLLAQEDFTVTDVFVEVLCWVKKDLQTPWASREPFWNSRILCSSLVMVLTKKAKMRSVSFTGKFALLS